MKVKYFLSIVLIIAITIIIGTCSRANELVYVEKTSSQQGDLIRVVNHSPYKLYCYVDNGYSYFDFYVSPNNVSRWYFEPQTYYEWRCK